MKKDILVVSAMKMELPPIKGAVATGVGKEKAKKALGGILKIRKPSIVISVGLVGAVIPELKVGDLFIPEVIIDYEKPEVRYSPSLFPLPVGERGRVRGLLVTVPKVFKSEDKYKLKEIIPDATCVDMETSGVAEVLEPLGIPLICIKAVSDELDFDFSNKILLNENIKAAVKNCNKYLCGLLKKIS